MAGSVNYATGLLKELKRRFGITYTGQCSAPDINTAIGVFADETAGLRRLDKR
jgi:hypothetical protein